MESNTGGSKYLEMKPDLSSPSLTISFSGTIPAFHGLWLREERDHYQIQQGLNLTSPIFCPLLKHV